MRRLEEINSALPGLMAGTVLYGTIWELVGIFLVTDKLKYSIGLWIGVALALGLAYHMAAGLNNVLNLDEKGAQAAITKQSRIRYLIVIIVLTVLMITEVGNPLAAFAGVMGLKVSAYLQPLVTKWLCGRKLNKE